MAIVGTLFNLALWGGIIWLIVSRVRSRRSDVLPPSQNVHIPQPMGIPAPSAAPALDEFEANSKLPPSTSDKESSHDGHR